MKIAIYTVATGQIQRTATVIDETMAEAMLGVGEDYLEVASGVHDGTHYVASGVLVPFPTPPHPSAIWDWGTHTWTIALAEAKKLKWSEMKSARMSAEFGGFVFQANEYASDQLSASRIVAHFTMSKAILDAGQTFQAPFVLADGDTIVVLNATEMVQLGRAYVTFLRDLNEQLRQRRLAILAATTLAQVDAVVW